MLSLTCPHCLAQLTLPARRLLLRIDTSEAPAGELLFTCLSCHATAALDVDVRGAAAALAAGVTHLELTDIAADQVGTDTDDC